MRSRWWNFVETGILVAGIGLLGQVAAARGQSSSFRADCSAPLPKIEEAPVAASPVVTGQTPSEPGQAPTAPTPPSPPSPLPSAVPPSPPETGLLPAPETAAPDSGDGTVSLFDSVVGYIDNAIPASQLRLRFDAAYDNVRGTRAEFFYPRSGPLGPGLPLRERSVDFQELTSYLELAPLPRLSGFIEVPVRFLNPEINANHTGFGDLNTGFKYAFVYNRDTVASFQFRTFVPTAVERRGLGTGHVSLEPALLVNQRLTDRLTAAGELRYWVPIGGTDFAGDVIRYGVGLGYGERRKDDWWVTPVVEVVGWTVLSGKTAVLRPSGVGFVEDAAGQTIVNAKMGVRLGLGERGDIYTGYGRALTGNTWYKDIWRVEFRLFF
jgi:hypothetical protein